ncbi:hydroxymethylglutaryl-CoA lyase [Oceanicola sp. 22II-s10i]|uniref:hydroxymethylglutaryl-CoA lyase n=1 Tax=Oceanicola sp. 22II-s10i TaxID=1317116 RepID=UPI000B527DF4|nr:hydroxymethylglutaryl-CoA lyase [Oceanicola sp. 22II-s10i]OWU83141.1 hydroxymethylglutaryl-CoA lyase [Oceanicola sp. 22II-s10i]
MSDYPKVVEFHEEGPREGFQIEKRSYPLEQRARFVEALADTGLKQIQVGSFVSPKAVPTMADTPELFDMIRRRDDVRYTGLWLNEKGFQRALQTPGCDMEGKLIFYTTDTFCKMNNNCTVAENRDAQGKWAQLYLDNDVPLDKAYILTAFGCNFEGDVPQDRVLDNVRYLVDLCADLNVPMPAIYLADTVGWGNPEAIRRMIGAVRELVPDARIGTHLHDTRGVGAGNVLAALQMGVSLFDSSVAGLGGCPFSKASDVQGAGNICTEDMAFMCEEMGIDTGLDLEALLAAAAMAEEIIGRPLTGKLMHYGMPARRAA